MMKSYYLTFALLLFVITTYSQTNTFPTNGNVGIGTISPTTYKLEVLGNGQMLRNTSSTGYTTLRLFNNLNQDLRALEIDYAGTGYVGTLCTGCPVGESAVVTTTGAFPLSLGTNNTGRMFITSGGNVAIGTNDPKGYKLAVAGKIVSEEVVIKLQANWPDYVFEKDYDLPSLFELEKFILSNKHLPGVPSAEQIKNDGLQLGEMNSVLLKKVEELTLHIIALEKRIKALEK